MPTRQITVVGAGGHALVVIDALLSAGWSRGSIVVCDHDPQRVGQTIAGLRIVSPPARAGAFHVAIGNNDVRRRLLEALRQAGGEPVSVVHPAATISGLATIEPGCLVAAQAVIAPGARIGQGAIVNHAAVIDHESIVGAYSHIAPAATLGGAVRLGEGCLVGAGARILPRLVVGAGVTLGAGGVATGDLDAGAVYVGVPAVRVR